MNLLWKQVLQSIAMGLALPGLLLSLAERNVEVQPYPPETTQQEEVRLEESLYIPVVMPDGMLRVMELEEYVSRVVLGEMPANFDVEALKAQAVATRTYTLRRVERGDKHNGAVCTDYRCCQAYREPENYLAEGGKQERIDRLFDAVRQTHGQVLRYDGELISATYFASAGGSTEDACAVWGSSIPYLVPVSSPDDTLSQSITFKPKEFQGMLGVRLSGKPTGWFGKTTYTAGGGVDKLEIGGKSYSGVKLRSLLGLRSTVFTVTATADKITFTTQGFGHRVGMSQYGAESMAVSGSEYAAILAHYYPGTSLEPYQTD